MLDDKLGHNDNAPEARYGALGSRVKLVAGAFTILCCWFSLGLGFIAFGSFLFLHIVLQENSRIARQEFSGDIVAPLNGRITAIRQDGNMLQIDMTAHALSSQIIYAPLGAKVEDKIWIDGTYLPFDDASSHPLRARYDYLLQSEAGQLITLSLFGADLTRYIYAPFAEGQYVRLGEPFAFGLMRSNLTIQLPQDYEAVIAIGDDVIAKQSCLARRPMK